MPYYLTIDQLRVAVAAIAKKLDELDVDYAIMGGAAVCIMGNDPQRSTEDVDLVIHVDERNITADRLTSLLTKSKEFTAVR
jgi:predicted nucleotidyltransferase